MTWMMKAMGKFCSCSHLPTLVLRSRILLSWRWRR
jgi:hypothetical protein